VVAFVVAFAYVGTAATGRPPSEARLPLLAWERVSDPSMPSKARLPAMKRKVGLPFPPPRQSLPRWSRFSTGGTSNVCTTRRRRGIHYFFLPKAPNYWFRWTCWPGIGLVVRKILETKILLAKYSRIRT